MSESGPDIGGGTPWYSRISNFFQRSGATPEEASKHVERTTPQRLIFSEISRVRDSMEGLLSTGWNAIRKTTNAAIMLPLFAPIIMAGRAATNTTHLSASIGEHIMSVIEGTHYRASNLIGGTS